MRSKGWAISRKCAKIAPSEEQKTTAEKKQKKKKAKLPSQDEEEKAYQKQLWLKDHGKELMDTPPETSPEPGN